MENNDKYANWCKNISKGVSGERNSQYGVSVKDRMKTQEGYDAFCKSCARGTCGDNPNARPIRMWNDDFSMEFDSIKSCSLYLIENKYTTSTTCNLLISTAITKKRKYLGFWFEKI